MMLLPTTSFSQDEDLTENDSIVYKQKYGIRVGADVFKLVRTFLDDDYTGFEVNADYRLTKRIFLAGELGTEEKSTKTDFLDITTTGSYFKAGVDFNFYRNWLDMENMIYGGLRVGVSSFSQQLNSFTVYDVNNQYWNSPFTSNDSQNFKGLSALWAEIVFGIKAEIFNNLYLGLNIQFKSLITEDEPNNFVNVYIPGFNKTFDSGSFGVGFGYNVSYLIPIYKKNK